MASTEIQSYLNDIARYPVLSKDAQLLHCKHIRAWLDHEDAPTSVVRAGQRALHAMIRTNLRLVVSVAKGYQSRGLEFKDLIQEGNLGLIRGLQMYDPSRGYAVSTYVYWWIRQAISRALYSSSRPIRIPVNTHELLVRIHRYINRTLTETGHAPSITEIAANTNISESRVNYVLDTHLSTTCISFDALCSESDNPILDVLAAPSDVSSDPDAYVHTLENKALAETIFTLLSPVQTQIVKAYFYENRSLADVASEIGVSRARASQIQQEALKKIRIFLVQQGYEH